MRNFVGPLSSKKIPRFDQNSSFSTNSPQDYNVLIWSVLQLKKSSRRIREKPSGSSEEGEVIGAAGQAMDAIENTSKVKVENVGDTHPVRDFEAMLSRRDSPHWVRKALQSMKDKIHDLVENSFEGDTYQEALECLVALRKGCILEQVYFLRERPWLFPLAVNYCGIITRSIKFSFTGT